VLIQLDPLLLVLMVKAKLLVLVLEDMLVLVENLVLLFTYSKDGMKQPYYL